MADGWGTVEEFEPISLELDDEAGDFECYVWRKPDGSLTINAQLYRIEDGYRAEATPSLKDVRRIISALSSAASFVEQRS